jgi:hypothetical protein
MLTAVPRNGNRIPAMKTPLTGDITALVRAIDNWNTVDPLSTMIAMPDRC